MGGTVNGVVLGTCFLLSPGAELILTRWQGYSCNTAIGLQFHFFSFRSPLCPSISTDLYPATAQYHCLEDKFFTLVSVCHCDTKNRCLSLLLFQEHTYTMSPLITLPGSRFMVNLGFTNNNYSGTPGIKASPLQSSNAIRRKLGFGMISILLGHHRAPYRSRHSGSGDQRDIYQAARYNLRDCKFVGLIPTPKCLICHIISV